MRIKLAVVDDHFVMRDGLVRQLTADSQIEVIAEATNGLDMLQQLKDKTVLPDIAVMDLRMPVMDGFILADELKKQYPSIHILVLSAYCSEYNVASMVSKGVRGYLCKDCSPIVFRSAIHSIYEPGYYYSELASEQSFKILQDNNLKSLHIPEREMEFLKWCCTEMRYDQIAEKMGITRRTLDGCRERLFDRLGVKSRFALMVMAMQSGITVNEIYNPINFKIKF